MSAELACFNCGGGLIPGLLEKRKVAVHYCSKCGFYSAYAMPRDMAIAMFASRKPVTVE